MRKYNVMYGVGKVKYLVNTHDGVSTHKDGSPFYGCYCFKNKAEMDKYITTLEQQGYRYSNVL